MSGLQDAASSCKPDTTLSSTPDQQLENHSTKYHRQQPLYITLELLMMGIVVQTGHITLSSTPDQQPLYNTLELLMMGIVVPETC